MYFLRVESDELKILSLKFYSLFAYLFIYMTERERAQGGRERKKVMLPAEPQVGLDPRTLGS